MTDHQEIWCQPSDQPKRQFLIMFDDPQMDVAVFDDEDKARAFWEKANLNWTCYLMGTMPRYLPSDRSAPASLDVETRQVLKIYEEALLRIRDMERTAWDLMAYDMQQIAGAAATAARELLGRR